MANVQIIVIMCVPIFTDFGADKVEYCTDCHPADSQNNQVCHSFSIMHRSNILHWDTLVGDGIYRSKGKPGESLPSSTHSSRQQSPTHLATPPQQSHVHSAPPTRVSSTALHGIVLEQDRSTKGHKPSRSKSFKTGGETSVGERTGKASSRHRSSSVKQHKAPTSAKTHSSHKT